jgi:hypothetical protein
MIIYVLSTTNHFMKIISTDIIIRLHFLGSIYFNAYGRGGNEGKLFTFFPLAWHTKNGRRK